MIQESLRRSYFAESHVTVNLKALLSETATRNPDSATYIDVVKNNPSDTTDLTKARSRLAHALVDLASLSGFAESIQLPAQITSSRVENLEDLGKLLTSIDQITEGEDQDYRTNTLLKIFNSFYNSTRHDFILPSRVLARTDSPYEFNMAMDMIRFNESDLNELFKSSEFMPLLEFFRSYPEEYRFQLSYIYSLARLDQLPLDQTDAVRTSVENITLNTRFRNSESPTVKDWYLCEAAEAFMLESLNEGDFTVIEYNGIPLIIIKNNGKKTGICLRDFVAGGKKFIAENFYSPTDESTRELIDDAIDNSIKQIPLSAGEWTYMRTVDSLTYGTNHKPLSSKYIINRDDFLDTVYSSIPAA